MSVIYLGCAYSLEFSIKLNGNSQNILATKWFFYFSDGTWKTYYITLFNISDQKKSGTISKTFSSKSKKENETTYIQINNLDAVKLLQKRKDTIKITIEHENAIEAKRPDAYSNQSEMHCINPTAFIDTKQNLFYLDKPYNYFLIKQFLTTYLDKTKTLSSIAPPEEPEAPSQTSEPTIATDKEANPPQEKENKGTPQLPAPFVSPSKTSSLKIQPISACCNLKIIVGIILAISTTIIANFCEIQFIKKS